MSLRRFGLSATSVLAPSVSLGRALGSRASTFVEYGASVGKGYRPLHLVDLGTEWFPNPDTELDLSVGVGLSDATPDLFLGLGLQPAVLSPRSSPSEDLRLVRRGHWFEPRSSRPARMRQADPDRVLTRDLDVVTLTT